MGLKGDAGYWVGGEKPWVQNARCGISDGQGGIVRAPHSSDPRTPDLRFTISNTSPVILITGASSGLGWALAQEMARRGWSTRLVARRADRLQEAVDTLTSRYSQAAHAALALDLADPDAPQRCIDWLNSWGDWPEVVVHNAGLGRFGRWEAVPWDIHQSILAVQVRSVVALTGTLLGPMLQRGRGMFVFVGSTSGRKPVPFLATYAASKAFLHQWALALGEELRGTAVRSLLVIPGFIGTGFHERGGLPAEVQPARSQPLETVARRVADAIEGRRGGVLVVGRWRERLTGWLQRLFPGERWAVRMGRFYERWLPPVSGEDRG
ncbi:MAG: SDR family NAD(P)-dependent oxidoreductase [Acidobacteria bacterium]|nr:SDR family NAD(P)-dependent oxidoreductase [Acidobacteriota bacterium]MDW7985259.1 SDR family NAD(P)-dependent oxidoreductase [Acidobacteriota bacterium]